MIRKLDTLSTALVVAVAAAIAGGRAQAADASGDTLEEVIVTGTAIPTAPDEIAVPVETLDAAQLRQTGTTGNALEMLRKSIPAFQGRSNAGNSNANNNNQNTAGGSQLQLRNLPTLVLVDGRRVANSGIGGINGKNFVDVNQIPADSIDHVDVLTDGASSLYGSDAIGGVVNFVLKSNYQGLRAGVRAGTASNYGEGSVFVQGGMPVGRGNITATASITYSDPLFQNERAFSNPLVNISSNVPGVVGGGAYILNPYVSSPGALNPTGTAATATSMAQLVANGTYLPTTAAAIRGGFNVAPYQTILMRQDMKSLVSRFHLPLGATGSVELFGDLMASQGKSWTRWLPVAAAGLTVPAGSAYDPLTGAMSGVVFTYLPYGHTFNNTVNAYRFTAGLRGTLGAGWQWETAAVYSESDLEQLQGGLIYKPNLPLAIAGGYDASGNALAGGAYSSVHSGYSLTGPMVTQPALNALAANAGVSPASLANVFGTERIRAASHLVSWDAKIVGEPFGVPAGKVGVAAGVSLRRESLSGSTDPNGRVTDPVTQLVSGNDQQWLGGTYADPFSKSRTISGAFLEVRIPVTSDKLSVPGLRVLDLTGSVRGERYSDAGNSTVPKLGFRWQPFGKQLTVRGNYAKSFIAPTLYSEYGPTDTRQVGAAVIQGVFGASYAGMPFNGEDGNNPALQPATSNSRTIGFVFRPQFAPGFTLNADYSHITLSGFQGGIGFNTILNSVNTLGSASPFFGNLAVDGFPGSGATNPFTAPGALKTFLTNGAGLGDPNQANRLYLVDQFRNLSQLEEKSWNFGAEYNLHTQDHGAFDLRTNGTLMQSFTFQGLPGQTYIEYAGHTTNNGVFGGTLPRYRFYTSLAWSVRDFTLSLGNTWAAPTTDTGAGGNLAPVHVSGYTTWDLRAESVFAPRGFKEVRAAVGVNNLANAMPPLAPRAYSDNNADVSSFSPIGRLVYLTVSVGM
ncbi:MAG: TonB-dependent receptor plug domain-containing protein [Gammaproteobacteria bacterium]|nr:TonB-dependent receptor plug domain-containing protein [Gammaproteobacteria bacterium]